jgi:hypothetical protein
MGTSGARACEHVFRRTEAGLAFAWIKLQICVHRAPKIIGGRLGIARSSERKLKADVRANDYLVSWPSMAVQASSASVRVSKGEPPTLIALLF